MVVRSILCAYGGSILIFFAPWKQTKPRVLVDGFAISMGDECRGMF
jgi:hypothetical protein